MRQTKNMIGLYGGTFDPIHCGHIHVAKTLLQALPLDEIQFIPCFQPPHRQQPQTDFTHRLTMLQLALANEPQLTINDIENQYQGPSYSIKTIKHIRQQHPSNTHCFILGVDSFASFNQWHQWQDFLNFCHLIIVNRPGYQLPQRPWLQHLLDTHQVSNSTELENKQSGAILIQTIPPSKVNSTELRQQLQEKNYNHDSLPSKVIHYIKQHKLYTK